MQAPASRVSLTSGLALITAAAWLLVTISGLQGWAVEQGGFIPLRFSGSTIGFVLPVWVTPFTATLVHGDVFHILLNMMMLVFCGQPVERTLGWNAIVILYTVGAVTAAVGQYVIDPGSPVPMIGASGAISAVVAVYALLFSRNEVKAIGPIPGHLVRALWLAVAWTALQWLIGVATSGGSYQVATAAHVGGFLAGLALARPLLAWRYRTA